MFHDVLVQELQCLKDKSFGDVVASVGAAAGSALVSAAPGHGKDVVVVAGSEVASCGLAWLGLLCLIVV